MVSIETLPSRDSDGQLRLPVQSPATTTQEAWLPMVVGVWCLKLEEDVVAIVVVKKPGCLC
jgi:hypothetical protein